MHNSERNGLSRLGGGDRLRVGIVDTGVNPWHSHVRGGVQGCRIFLDPQGRIAEDDDFRDLAGHGTAVAGVLRQGLPDAEIFAVRVFDPALTAYPSLVARAILRAAGAGCQVVNLSLAMPIAPGSDILAQACALALEAGCLLVAAGDPQRPGLLPASLPGVLGVVADASLPPGEITFDPSRPYAYSACDRPRDLSALPNGNNLWGNSFACARVAVHAALQRHDRQHGLLNHPPK